MKVSITNLPGSAWLSGVDTKMYSTSNWGLKIPFITEEDLIIDQIKVLDADFLEPTIWISGGESKNNSGSRPLQSLEQYVESKVAPINAKLESKTGLIDTKILHLKNCYYDANESFKLNLADYSMIELESLMWWPHSTLNLGFKNFSHPISVPEHGRVKITVAKCGESQWYFSYEVLDTATSTSSYHTSNCGETTTLSLKESSSTGKVNDTYLMLFKGIYK
jgi:hypothetical protein